MNTYFSTFVTGLQKVVKFALKNQINDVQISQLLDGLVIYKSRQQTDQIKKIRFLNNTFILMHLFNGKKNYTAKDLLIMTIRKPYILSSIPRNVLRNASSFRVIASEENRLVSVNKVLMSKVETILFNKFGLRVNRSLPDLEVWFLTRSERLGLIGLRITKTPNYEKTLHKGELIPELANLMCILAELRSTDVVLDPFAGYGAIPLECASGFKVKQVIAGEKEKRIFKILQEKIKVFRQKTIVGKWDALDLSSLTDNSINKIITDPPWGLFDKQNIDLKEFYQKMLKEFSRVLIPKGLLIVLTAQKEIFENLVKQYKRFKLLEKYDILVSGKKASIYKMQFK